MIITLNNDKKELTGSEMSVANLLKTMNFTFPMIVVKVNGLLVKKESYRETMVRENDVVEAIHLISGG